MLFDVKVHFIMTGKMNFTTGIIIVKTVKALQSLGIFNLTLGGKNLHLVKFEIAFGNG